MTGAEFASKYTVLKPLDQRAVRSFVAQEQSTRRAVMVHWLDQLSASDRSAILARLDRLPPDARERVLAVESVDGAPVVVTRMILDFDSFGKWLDRVAPAAPSGGFTDIFVASGAPRGAPVAEIDSPTVSWTPPSVPKVQPPPQPPIAKAPPPEPKSEPKPHAPAISVRFREPASGPKPPAAAPQPPAAPPPPAPKLPAPLPKAPAPGEFTRIFGAKHVEPDPPPAAQPQFMPPPAAPMSPMAPMGGSGAAPSATSAMERVVAPPPRPVAPLPPPPSPSSPWTGPPPVVPLPPSPSPSATPMPGANINLPPAAPVMPAQPVQSDFTRIIGAAGPAPVATPVSTPAPPTAPAPPPAGSKVVMPVLVALGAMALSALVLVIYFIIRR